MKERPISFSGEMVRAILDGRKTQTRRVVKGVESLEGLPSELQEDLELRGYQELISGHLVPPCPYGDPGSQLWVRENFAHGADFFGPEKTFYQADHVDCAECTDGRHKWKPSIHMPRAASRITLEITGVRIERLQDISEEDALAEGVGQYIGDGLYKTETGTIGRARTLFQSLWEEIKGIESWKSNPWVWVIEFRRV